ncbi:procathepsin L-like [Ruditapes philippinarum]|uniref:procathepsin L-like n=1 Tax=Ruditapes philippinarum TaxID=129788 RepID=UPI00295AAC46|nr:procathepsin L-like [Ruditapes philippinarum]
MTQFFLFSCLIAQSVGLFFDAELDKGWSVYKVRYGRQYDAVDNIQRRVMWERTIHYIQAHNLEYSHGLHTYTLGPNQFSDMAPEEFSSLVNGFNESIELDRNVCSVYAPPKDITLDKLNKTVDWRTHGYVTNIKDQGMCRSCYAFSATGALEGQQYKTIRQLVSISDKNIIDCSYNQGNKGCDGGTFNNAFKYVMENGGLVAEKSYPYLPRVDKCSFENKYVIANMTSCRSILPSSERDLLIAVALEGPVSVAIDASQKSFQSYRSGVYDDPTCTNKLNHAVLIVGYGTENGQDYWLVKNSWGAQWGENGYIRIARNKNNMCGIANKASFPVM